MTEINYNAIGRKVAALYPELVKEMMVSPALEDINLIPEIFSNHFKDPSDSEKRMVFIGVILSLYDPDVLAGWKPTLKYGIRTQIAKIYSVGETVISHNLQTVRNYYLIYKKYKSQVDTITNQIKEEYEK